MAIVTGEISRLVSVAVAPESYAARRDTVVKQMSPLSVAIFPAALSSIRSHDTEYRYRQDNDFFYLTGFPEPEALCLLSPQHETERFILFVRPRDQEKETWTGNALGSKARKSTLASTQPIRSIRLTRSCRNTCCKPRMCIMPLGVTISSMTRLSR